MLLYDLYLLIICIICSYGWYKSIPQQNHIYKSFIFLLFIDIFTSFLFYIFDIFFGKLVIIINIIYLILLYFIYILSKIKSDKINKKNICLVFYKPKNITNSLKFVLSSFGILINGKLYQMRYEAQTLQERDYTNEYIYNKYLIVDTKFNYKNLKEGWKEDLLKQKRKSFYGLFRLNCLKSCKNVLKQIKGFEYNNEILPSIYLLKLKLRKKI